ncbi:MAG TPA: DUF5916 domain-containing protein [Chitinophagaceae bacterium]|nr:DUF5916 domain-containing protein [Chitinophagaceae bacterium]
MFIVYYIKSIISFLLFSFLPIVFFAQEINNTNYQQEYQLRIAKATDVIKIDGELNEASWQNAHFINNFWLQNPDDNRYAKRQTEVRITYDANFLYVGIINYDTSYYVIQTLKRDVNPGGSDGVGVVIDPLNGRSNGFLFTVNPYNVQAEDLLSAGGGNNEINFSWDNKWFSQTARHKDRWIAEMAIPFKTLRYEEGKTTWGINFVRSDRKNNEYSTWTRIPVNLQFFDFGYTGALIWDAPPPKPGRNISVIPYITAAVTANPEDGEKTDGELNQGFDAKIALSSKLNLDLTVNPDFSQVEVDQQVTNLTRFNIFFPERRTFFIENADLFTQYGIPPIRPFYSRTIGLDKDGNRIPIYAGARLSGNLDNKTRFGIMTMQTGKKGDFAAQNYSAISVTRRWLKRSIIKAYYLGREAFMSQQKKKDNPLDRYGRNAGFEIGYTSNKGDIQNWFSFHQSWKYGINKDDHYLNGGFAYSSRKINAVFNYDGVGVNYYTDMGFVQRIENYDAALDTSFRLGFKQLYSNINYTMFPEKGKLNSHKINAVNFFVWNPDGSFNERSSEFAYLFNFKNTAELKFGLTSQDVRLLYPTSFTDYDPLPKDTYRFSNYSVRYQSDRRTKFNFTAGIREGGFYNGSIQQYTLQLNYRTQPWGNFGVAFEYNDLDFPDPYGKAALFLVAPRIEINFSNSLFWTTFIQYNTQENNFNINSRFQWRYKPMSDIFLVYTDNYFVDPSFKNRNRALVFKMNYWLNL